jgi:hypothetical protein
MGGRVWIVILGLTSGLLGGLLAIALSQKALSATTPAQPQASLEPVRASSAPSKTELIIQQTRDAESCKQDPERRHLSRTDASLSPQDSRTPEGRRALVEKLRHQQTMRVQAHQQEPIDPEWARGRTNALRAGFAQISAYTSIKLDNLDCRAVSCVANLVWKDAATARNEMTQVISNAGEFAPGAVRYLNLDADDTGGPMKATFVFDWTESATHEYGGK